MCEKVDQARIGRFTVIEVHDNGNGIPLILQPKIFEPFTTT